MFTDSLEIGEETLHRACLFLLKLGRRVDIYVPHPRHVHFMMSSETNVQHYLRGNCRFKLHWMEMVNNNKIVFIPTKRNGRWNATVLWRDNGKDYFVRVYTMDEVDKGSEPKQATLAVGLCHQMAPKLPVVPWVLHPAHDVLYEQPTRRRSGLILLARL